MSNLILKTCKDGDSTPSLGILFQYLTSFTVREFFLIFHINFPCGNLRPLLLFLFPIATEKSLSYSHLLGIRSPFRSSSSPCKINLRIIYVKTLFLALPAFLERKCLKCCCPIEFHRSVERHKGRSHLPLCIGSEIAV